MTNPDTPTSDQVKEFTHRGYDCTVLMGPFTINGYVVLPDDHPWLQTNPMSNPTIDVHGGITYHQGRVIGFDTNHFTDSYHPESKLYKLNIAHDCPIPPGHVWSWEEVTEETKRLAEQAREAEQDN